MYPVLFTIHNFTVIHFILLVLIYIFGAFFTLLIIYKKGLWSKDYLISAFLYFIPVIIAGLLLYKQGGFAFRSYSFLYSIAFIVSLIIIYFFSERYGLSLENTLYSAIIIATAGIVGARIFYVVNNIGNYNMISALEFWKGGFNFPGGLVLAFISVIIFFKVKKLNILKYPDFLFWAFSLSQAISHQGCFLNGCCYGTPTNLPWGVQFPKTNFYSGPDVPIHPIQVYKTISYLLFFFLGRYLFKNKKFNGEITSIYLVWFGLTRFLTDFIRGDETAAVKFYRTQFTTIQVLALFIIIIGIIIFINRFIAYKKSKTLK